MQQIILVGNVGQDASTKPVKQDTVTGFSVACNEKAKGEEKTQWYRCALWGKRGAALEPYLVKGTPVTIVGKLALREYEKDGKFSASLDVTVTDIKIHSQKKAGPVADLGGDDMPF